MFTSKANHSVSQLIHVYAPTSNAEEAERFYEDLQDLLELIPPKKMSFSLQGTGMLK